ncbi:fimbria/pilus outer membrane usher protein [Neomegalonema perideroedes]|uniref:fimbria/pilus outer membrane usher protein n=1 Tax=Neomegalonema perideroedes TaxID=217219 RepID=UPI0012FDA8B7|nr:fimbria/pilus outer membrane usher protein [Neomegalonema perideroedes]
MGRGAASGAAFLIAVFCGGSGAAQTPDPLSPEVREVLEAGYDAEGFDPGRRAAEVPLPLHMRGVLAGDLRVRLRGEILVGADPRQLAEALAEVLNAETLERLRALGPDYATPEELAAAGLRLSYDPGALTLEADAAASAFQDLDLFLSRGADFSNLDLIEPARFSLGVDGSLSLTQNLNRGGDPNIGAYVDGFANFGGPDGVYVDFAGRVDLSPQVAGDRLHRDRLTLFKDDRERATRYSAVDVSLDPPPLIGAPDWLGVSVERRYSEIDPNRLIRSLGQRSILLERPAVVEVWVNGALVSRFRAPSGRVNLNDIPFVDLGNEVTIYVEDELGRRQLDSFSFSSGDSLLAPGLSEFGLAAGARQQDFTAGVEWETDDFGAQGYYRRGVTPNLTLGAGAGAGKGEFLAASLHAVAALPYGVGQLDAAWSTRQGDSGERRSGFAAAASYDASFEGAFHGRDQIALRVEYRSDGFSNFSGLENMERFSGSAAYHLGLNERTSLNLGARYGSHGGLDEFSLRAGISHRFRALSTSLLVEHVQRDAREDETRLLLSASMPIDEDSTLSASYASARERATLDYRKRHQDRVGDYGYNLRAERDDGSMSLYGRADYIGNRFEASASVDHLAPDVDSLFGRDAPLVGAVRVGSGVAVADGHFGVGRRVGQGFFLVKPHATLDEARLAIGRGADQSVSVRTDGWGPILAPASGGYRVSEVALSVEEAPIGYDLGPGVYAMQTGARGGGVILIGGEAFYSARGVLLDSQGEPLTLRYGKLIPLQGGHPAVDLFTNAAGVFFAGGLAPGPHELEVDGERLRVEIQAPREGALIELGEVSLGGGL